MSETAPISPPADEVAILFKSKKNRKQLRSRPNPDNDDEIDAQSFNQDQTQNHQPGKNSAQEPQHKKQQQPNDLRITTLSRPATATSDDAKSPTNVDSADAAPAVSSVMRRAKRPRLMGIAFHSEALSPDDDHADNETSLASPPSSATAKVDKSAPAAIAGGIKRFAPQTGIMGTLVNQHMEQYIESQLTRRKSSVQESTSPATENPSASSSAPFTAPAPTLNVPTFDGQKPTQLGKLMEVDLGDEARMKTLDMIERARRGENSHDLGAASNKRKHNSGRRGSDDIKRDQIVESFLHENRLDIYDVPKPRNGAAQTNENLNELPADDRVAEQFRRDFIDAMSQRVRRRRAARAPAQTQNNRPGAKRDDEVLKGPKLGGSRNVRAQMRDILLQKEKEKARDNKRR